AASTDLLILSLVNGTAASESLTGITLAGVTVGPGTPGQLDADWQRVDLVPRSGSSGSSVAPIASSHVTGGTLTFSGLSISIAPGDTVRLALRSGASLEARDGDALRLELTRAADLALSPPVLVAATWPLRTTNTFTVDGMSAAQIGVRDVGETRLLSGSARNLVFSVVLPSDGYAPDVMTRINVVNEGSGTPESDIKRLEAWTDADGDGRFDQAVDTPLGVMSYTGNRWELTGLSVPVAAEGLHVFVTCDVTETATEGHTVRLAMPSAPDM